MAATNRPRILKPENRSAGNFHIPHGMRKFVAFFLLCLILTPTVPSYASKVAILISQNIKPYMSAVEGLTQSFEKDNGTELILFPLEKFEGKNRDALKERIVGEEIDLCVAVGPEAAKFLWSESKNLAISKLYTLVLNPENIIESPEDAFGISLNIPIEIQVQKIAKLLPGLKQPGLLYDPEINGSFYLKAAQTGRTLGLEIVPLKVSAKKDIPLVLRQNWDRIDGLWLIPDRTVISDTIIKNLVMKESVRRGIPVVGYNRFFSRLGSVLVFAFDYEEIGRQTANMAKDALAGKNPRWEPPLFHVLLNLRVMKKLGLEVPADDSVIFEERDD